MVRKRMTKERRRQSIIEAAIAVIARTSFERCTVAVIARDVGVSEPVIYKHFTNKKGLQLAVLDSIYETFIDWIQLIDDIPSTSFSGIRDYGKRFQRALRNSPDRMIVMLKAQCAEDPDIKEKVWELLKSIHTAWVQIISKVFDRKRFGSDIDVEIVAWLMTGWVNNLFLLNHLGRPDEIPEKQVDQFSKSLDQLRRIIMDIDK